MFVGTICKRVYSLKPATNAEQRSSAEDVDRLNYPLENILDWVFRSWSWTGICQEFIKEVPQEKSVREWSRKTREGEVI